MLKKIFGIMLLCLIALAIFVYADSWGTATLQGTVKFPNGSAVNGSNLYGEIFLYEVIGFLNTSYGVVANLSIQTSLIDSTGGYSFSNLENGRMYTLLAFYINSSRDYFISDIYNGSIVMNSTFTTEFNSTYNVTFLNSSTGTAEYNITVEAV